MMELMEQLEEILSDLLQSGADTGALSAARRLEALAPRCESCGLHTAHTLLTELAAVLKERSHQLEKDDLPLTQLLCRTSRYMELCREKLQEETILERWNRFS